MKIFKADLHIHSCLSPCADLDMSPKAIVEEGLRKGLDLIAICDHNSAENVGAGIRAGKNKGLVVIPGIEICTKEEVHVLALFEKEEDALSMQNIIYRYLKGTNRPEIFGDQVIVNEFDEVEGFNMKLLIGATQLNIYQIEKEVHKRKGLFILSHVDRPSYSIISQLGFIPNGIKVDAVEICGGITKIKGFIENYPIVRSSDAHFLKDIGKKYTKLLLKEPNFGELVYALEGKEGRAILQ